MTPQIEAQPSGQLSHLADNGQEPLTDPRRIGGAVHEVDSLRKPVSNRPQHQLTTVSVIQTPQFRQIAFEVVDEVGRHAATPRHAVLRQQRMIHRCPPVGEGRELTSGNGEERLGVTGRSELLEEHQGVAYCPWGFCHTGDGWQPDLGAMRASGPQLFDGDDLPSGLGQDSRHDSG
ncbi:hypothetical protein CRH09_15560 [Nocardia terpenica]|uniref:Uncharacterized protein n=1 Tax=Nocardia terpenica TaxID=455432 RepID=A0A291RJS0_9NOCA|nr:hypothetical protein CRH09_15560 [Nocardia terpenica]